MKRELFAGVVAVTVMSLPGTAAAEPTSQPVPPDKIDSIILSQDDVSAIVGATMVDEKSFPKPDPPEDVDKSECAVLFDMNSDSFGDDHEAFKANVQKDSKGDDFADHTVILQVAIYSDTDTPAKLFQTLFQSASSCT
ncbi:MAG: sensor domain-containing protein, partial [Mycobacterium sp.]